MLKYETHWNKEPYIKEKYGHQYAGHPMIFQDSPIQGGVFFRGLGEAITVDPSADWRTYIRLERDATRAALQHGAMNTTNVMRGIFEAAGRSIEYSKQGVQSILHQEAVYRGLPKFPLGEVVDLSAFLRGQKGVCRHQALASAWLLERFVQRGDLGGKPSVDENEILFPGNILRGHVWARHTEPGLEPEEGVAVIDIAQGYHGPLAESSEMANWNYYRPSELHLSGNNLDPELVLTELRTITPRL